MKRRINGILIVVMVALISLGAECDEDPIQPPPDPCAGVNPSPGQIDTPADGACIMPGEFLAFSSTGNCDGFKWNAFLQTPETGLGPLMPDVEDPGPVSY